MKNINRIYDNITPKTSPEALAEKVSRIAEEKSPSRRIPFRPVMAIAAAAVTMSALVVTAGAANGWDYAGIFSSIFGEKSENIAENIVSEATVLQDTIDTMDFELVAAAADKHSVLAILDVYSENGYKLIEDGGEVGEIIHPLQDLFISINSPALGSSGTGINILEMSEERVRLSIRMNTDTAIKDEKLTLNARLQNEKDENGEYIFDINADYVWSAEFTADYSGEEISYEKEMTLWKDTAPAKVTGIEVSPISAYFEGENLDNFFAFYRNADETYAILDSGEKVRIIDITSSSYESDSPTGSVMLSLGFEEPVNPEEITAIALNDQTIELK